ncbi:MAG TPA: maleylpyruvate isomerase family mycothiol-dependent enzyme, partial [Acidimicrobiia bacterium]
MSASRTETTTGFLDELDRFSALVRSLDDTEWKTASRCDGWTCADLAAHVTGTLTDILAGRFDGLGTPAVTEREVVERRGRTQSELADELAEDRAGAAALLDAFDDEAWNGPAPAGVPGTLGHGIETLWFDTYVHAEDIRAAIGRAPQQGPGIAPSVRHIAAQLEARGWGPATLELSGLDPVEIGGGGRVV